MNLRILALGVALALPGCGDFAERRDAAVNTAETEMPALLGKLAANATNPAGAAYAGGEYLYKVIAAFVLAGGGLFGGNYVRKRRKSAGSP